jgi:F-type H+-transporting ATPase subunit gamma
VATLEALRQQIESAEDMKSIVSVMKTLSAVSIAQYQNAAERMRDYQDVVDRGLQAVMMDPAVAPASMEAESGPAALIVFGSDQGLCGRFNEIVVAHTHRQLKDYGAEAPVLAVGERGAARLESTGISVYAVLSQPGSVSGLTRTAERLLVNVDKWRRELDVEKVVAIFNTEVDKGGITARAETLLPLDQTVIDRIMERPWPSQQIPLFDGDAQTVFRALVRERLYTALMRAGAESLAAEHATRLSAMQAAERNITDRVDDLTGAFRRQRQDEITDELMEIVSAYNSLS